MKSFTLIELVVVIAIIAILAAVILPNAYRVYQKAMVARMGADMRTIKNAVLAYKGDTGRWPACHYVQSNSPLLQDPGIRGWDGPYTDVPGISPLVKKTAPGGCPLFGFYYVWWDIASSGEYAVQFDLDGNGTREITTAVSVSVYGVIDESAVLKVDDFFDDHGQLGHSGNMNAYFPSCGGTGLVTLYVGTR